MQNLGIGGRSDRPDWRVGFNCVRDKQGREYVVKNSKTNKLVTEKDELASLVAKMNISKETSPKKLAEPERRKKKQEPFYLPY